jgi:FolB domain-containing protein
MTDRILIEDLEVAFCVGVPDEERARPQRLWVTVEMETDFAAAAGSDDLRHTIDYYAVSRRILGLGAGRTWRLIETLAVEIAELVLGEYAVQGVRVVVKKFILPEARQVAVEVRRSR